MDKTIERFETIEEALNQLSGGRVLDLATGSGGFVNYLIDNLQDYIEITGIDSNEQTLEAARKAHPQANLKFLPMDAAHLDFADGHFDLVCMANSVHHMADLPGVLSEMVRVCKPGGHILICEMYRDGQTKTQLTHVYLHHWWAAVDSAGGITHFETLRRQQIVDMVEKLHLINTQFFDSKNLDTDPKDQGLIRELDGIIDRFIQRAASLNGGEDLRLRGELLRLRVHEIGFHGASSLIAIGEKPTPPGRQK